MIQADRQTFEINGRFFVGDEVQMKGSVSHTDKSYLLGTIKEFGWWNHIVGHSTNDEPIWQAVRVAHIGGAWWCVDSIELAEHCQRTQA